MNASSMDSSEADMYMDPDGPGLLGSPLMRPVRVDLNPDPSPSSPKDIRYDQFQDDADPNGWPFMQLDLGTEDIVNAYESNDDSNERPKEKERQESPQAASSDLAGDSRGPFQEGFVPTVARDSDLPQSSTHFSAVEHPTILPPLVEHREVTEHSTGAAYGNSTFFPYTSLPRSSTIPGHGSPPKSPDAFRRELPSPGRGHSFINANSHRRLSQNDSTQYSSPGNYSSSNIETPSTDASGSTPTAMAIDRMTIDGPTNPQIGAFHCTYPGCTASPFQTQYLLNSHANVHDSNRPHYCNVKGCPRSEGGKGFKKKNEMIRHGLVHDSPGYVCPFCPDREHKYPRPDNLMRHVRVHHVEKDKDDSQIRDVLSRPPEGPSGGRRRRGFLTSGSTEEHTQQTAGRLLNDQVSPIKIDELPDRHLGDIESQMPENGEAAFPTYNINSPGSADNAPWTFPKSRSMNGDAAPGHPLVEVPQEDTSGNLNRDLTGEGQDPVSPYANKPGDEDEYMQPGYAQSVYSQAGNYPTPKLLCEQNPPATDSGYASMGRWENAKKDDDQEDARTVYTDNQDLQVPENVKEKLISTFSNELMRQLQVVVHNIKDGGLTWNTLAELLKEFSLRLSISACTSEQKKAITFIRHFRNRIANSVDSLIRSFSELHDEQLEDEGEEWIAKKQDEINVVEKVNLWNVEQPDTGRQHDDIPKINEANNVTHGEDDIEEDYAITHFPDAWTFLTSCHAYQWLVSRMRAELLLTRIEGTRAAAIKIDILKELADLRRSEHSRVEETARFEIAWDLIGFLKDKYLDAQEIRLGSLITIVGTGDEMQAITCVEYMKQVWPVTGPETLIVLQGALDQEGELIAKAIMTDGTRISMEIRDSIVVASVTGTESAISEIGQQLAWLGAALRPSPLEYEMAHSTPLLTFSPGNKDASFKLTFQVTILEPEAGLRNGSCWFSLFRNPIIVEGYPILARTNAEKGLEIPLNMMAGLSAASRATTFNGGVVIKGHSTMCCPTRRVKNSVLWHYIFNHDGSRLSYLSADVLCGRRALVPEVDAPLLEISRNFLGWTSSVEIQVGTKNVKYGDIDWAGSKFASPGVVFDNFHIAAGKFITGGASFTRGQQDTPIHLSYARRPYELQIYSAQKMKVIMYDVKDRRGWLVDGTSALLHLSRTKLSSSPYSDSRLFKLENFQHADPKAGLSGARKALLDPRNRELLLFEDSKTTTELKINTDGTSEQQMRKVTERWTYEDLVKETYHILEQIQDRQGQVINSPAIGLPFPGREKLLGFGFMDIVDGQNILLPRVATLKKSGWGWVDFTRSMNAIALLGKGFGDMIQPAEGSNKLCKYWNRVPEGQDYLVACISTLKEISRQLGDSDSEGLQLAKKAYWHKPDKLFESCDCKPRCRKASCDRVQVILPHSNGSKRPGDVFDCLSGAVIFGRSRKLPWRWPSRGESSEGRDSESEDEEGSEFHDSALGRSSSTTLELDVSTNAISSPSDRSPLDNSSTSRGGMAASQEIQRTKLEMSGSDGNKADNDDALMAGLESTKTFQMISRGVKRTLDKVAPQAFSRKRQNTGLVADEGRQTVDGETPPRHPRSPD
ncbi:hypothetical protein N431DRAFT_556628 [Stipitochalara longipes BDJ]|nr:hypothetical protein N431DRAFT_556628 [Stipitochalara longipes BDJ]